ncbi:MAG TPA: hypothetical protein VNW29_07435 [Candidatus Sulfotelmatobacter sp.]|jgi:hypothetical protein|nr:hypothetical protein [Candidatus Sulfotelmatobacter sp.]
MDRRGNVLHPNFSDWKKPPIVDGTAALQPDTPFPRNSALQLVKAKRRSSLPESFRDKLVSVRNNFAERYGDKRVKAYEIEQDVVLYKALATEKGTGRYAESKRSLDAYIDMQLQTHLGERLHVGISQLQHNIVDGELRVADTNESLLEMLDRGRTYRRKHGNRVDWDREEAEVVGFARIQEELADSETPVGTMMFFVSPPGNIEQGSNYQKNYFDAYWKIAKNKVLAFRYTSGLTPEESHQRLRLVDSRYDRDETPSDAEMIANPVKIESGTKGLENPDALHNFMHVNHQHMSKQKFDVVMLACQPLREDYKQSLRDNPDNLREHKRRLNILMNYADNVSQELESVSDGKVIALFQPQKDVRPWFPSKIDKAALARQEVRVVKTGCGSSGGEVSSPYSVAEHASHKEGSICPTCNQSSADNHYHCPGPECNRKYSNETQLDAGARTKKCNCGFEFNC